MASATSCSLEGQMQRHDSMIVNETKMRRVRGLHRCQYQRTKTWDKADKKSGENEKARQQAAKCTLKRHRHLVCLITARGCSWYCNTSCRHSTDLARAKIILDIFKVGARVETALNSKLAKTHKIIQIDNYLARSMRNTEHFN